VVGLKQMICRKCASHKVKVVLFETEGKKFAVCDDCGNVQSIGKDLQERYGKWMHNRERSD